MKIVLISAYFFPESSGGTERYVFDLAETLQNEGHSVEVISSAKEEAFFIYKNIRVHHLKNGAGNLSSFKSLMEILQGDVAHFHTLTPAFDIAHMELAKKAGYRVFFTSHIVGNTCIQGKLMQYNRRACDGKIRPYTCTACYLSAKGLPEVLARMAAPIVQQTGYPVGPGCVVAKKEKQLKKLDALCDCIFVFSKWQKETFTENSVDKNKVVVLPHAWTNRHISQILWPVNNRPNILRIGFAGRISPEKGLHVLIKSLKKLPAEKYCLHIAGVETAGQKKYRQKVLGLTHKMKNVTWQWNLQAAEMDNFFSGIDVLCIPSVWLETGPYVLFEALMQGVPVIASNIGGMKEWAAKGFPVSLFAHGNIKELAHTLLHWESPQQKLPLPVQSTSAITAAILEIYRQKQPAL